MLPKLYRQRYHALQQAIQQLQTALAGDRPADSTLQPHYQTVQNLFQHQILSLSLDQLAPDEQTRMQSYQTEINKQLRLLRMDVTFLQAARQSATASQRQEQMNDRLSMLLRYCGAVLQLDEDQR
jgi:hypothetical protein